MRFRFSCFFPLVLCLEKPVGWWVGEFDQEFPKKTEIINLINQSQMPVGISGFQTICPPSSGGSRDTLLWMVHWLRLPSTELTCPLLKALVKMIFLFFRWDMLVPWRLFILEFPTFTSWERVWVFDLCWGPLGFGGFKGGSFSFLRGTSPTIVACSDQPPRAYDGCEPLFPAEGPWLLLHTRVQILLPACWNI